MKKGGAPRHAHLKRVSDKIAILVMRFAGDVAAWREPPDFHLDELEQYVLAKSNATPGSAGRVLRELRRKGMLRYRLRSRASSWYRLEKDETETGAQCELPGMKKS